MSRNLIALQNRFLGKEKTAYKLLSEIREQRGKITGNDIKNLAREHQLPAQLLRTTAEFYDELRPGAKAKHSLKICNGEACQTAGSQTLQKKLSQHFSHFPAKELTIGEVTCLGYCSGGPNVMLDEQPLSGAIDPSKTIEEYLADGTTPADPEPENPCYPPAEGKPAVLMPYLTGQITGASVYDSLKNMLRQKTPEQILREIEASELRGRGGAGFPSGRKLRTVRDSGNDQAGKRKYLVVNFDEGDAGAYIDKELVERCPELLITGALLAAFACGASSIIIYARQEYPRARKILAEALKKAAENQLIGDAIAGSSFSCEVTMIAGQGAYICGEETSLLRSIEGLPAVVSIRPPFPAVEGLWGRPTAVCNVETLCNLPWIIAQGGSSYAALGDGKSRGTKLISLNHRVKNPGLYEVELGISLREMIFDLAGGMADGEKFKAVQIGGPLGGILPESALDTALGFESLQAAGGILGHGGMVVYAENDNLLQIARGLMAFCAKESCGKCFPCRIGSVRGMELLDQIAERGPTEERLDLLGDICETMKTGSLCAMGSMTPAGVESVMNHFPEELGKTS